MVKRGKGLKFTYSRPEDDPQRLALRIVELMQGVLNRGKDKDSHLAGVRAERQKAQQLQAVIFELKERKSGRKIVKFSRMDPYNTYDLDLCLQELEDYKTNARNLQNLADGFSQEVTSMQAEIIEVQTKLRKIHSAK